jgi:hypothetical protein
VRPDAARVVERLVFSVGVMLVVVPVMLSHILKHSMLAAIGIALVALGDTWRRRGTGLAVCGEVLGRARAPHAREPARKDDLHRFGHT